MNYPFESMAEARSFAVGICASDNAVNLGRLVSLLGADTFGRRFQLRRVIIVASGCDESALKSAREVVRKDERFLLIEEEERRGKSEAINRILGRCEEDFLLLLNGDAVPSEGSITKLLCVIDQDEHTGVASAHPVFDATSGVTSEVLRLMWTVHNECSSDLNHLGISNHCTDEMMVVRRDLIEDLPLDLVNDGAYIAGRLHSKGFRIRFGADAFVRIEVPALFSDLVNQRRRILFGHLQVWKRLGLAPRTVESMLFTSPRISLRILVKTLSRSPKLIRILPIAVVGEMISLLRAIWDTMRDTKKHGVWQRYGK